MTIVTATDFSKQSATALVEAAREAERAQVNLVCVHVMEEWRTHSSWERLVGETAELREQMYQERIARLNAFCRERLDDDVIEPERVTRRVFTGAPSARILELAEEVDASQIVIGSAGVGALAANFLGSTANDLVRRSQRPVLVVPPHEETQASRLGPILVPVDFSAVGLATLRYAGELARRDEHELVVVHATGPSPVRLSKASYPLSIDPGGFDRAMLIQRHGLEQIVEALDLDDLTDTVRVEVGEPHRVIRELVDELEARMVCMGSHGRQGVQRFLLGNTAERVLRQVPCPVLVLRETLEPGSSLRSLLELSAGSVSAEE